MQHAFKTSELAPEDRTAVERLLGRSLRNEESVELIVHEQDGSRQAREEAGLRATAAARIRELARGKGLGGATARELIEDGRRS
jgi:hypothetical protein